MGGEVARFLKDFFELNAVLFLCVYSVRDGLKMPIWKIAAYTLSFVTLFCLSIMILYSIVDIGYFSLLGTVLFIFGGALLLFRATFHEKGKLTFMLLLVLSYIFFIDNLGNTLCLMLRSCIHS